MTKLAHVCIHTDDLDKTEAFYRLLGLERQFDFRNLEDELVAFYLSFDDQTYIEVIKAHDAGANGALAHFAIEVDDLDSTCAVLAENGIKVSEKKLGIDRTWIASCNDPNGVFIELQQYTDDSMQLVGGTCQVDYSPDNA